MKSAQGTAITMAFDLFCLKQLFFEIDFRSMTDLVNDSTNTQSPKRKFSFRFPHLAHHSNSGDKDSSMASPNVQHHKGSHGFKTRNFSEEAKNVPDLQVNNLIIFALKHT